MKFNNMMKILPIILFFLALTHSAIAQPGGGGGIRILNILDNTGKPFIKGDSILQIKLYTLSKNEKKIDFEIQANQELNHQFGGKGNTRFYLPPYIREKTKTIKLPNQRLLLIYLNDTMTIDFIDVLPPNGAGNSDVVTNIYFKSGYYKSYRVPAKKSEEFWTGKVSSEKEKKEVLNALLNGINTNTDYILVGFGLLKHVPDPNLENKKLQRQRENCKESVNGKYYTLCFNNMETQDMDSTITISVNQNSDSLASSDSLHFYYFFMFNARQDMHNSETKLANSLLRKLTSYKIKINGNYFSGQIKFAVAYYNAGISSTYGMYIIYVNHYKEGKLVKSNVLYDVNPHTEERIERHN